MTNINKIINKYACTPYRYTIKKDVTIIDTRDGHFVFKKRKGNSNVEEVYRYLKSRSFDYYPKLLNSDDEYYIYEYVEDVILQ
jgi:2-iminoacetate synthase ThiH